MRLVSRLVDGGKRFPDFFRDMSETKAIKRIGLFFGSFNPIHIGHLIIANAIISRRDVDRVWFVVSPENPLKTGNSQLPETDRLDMVKVAIRDNPLLETCDVEFKMPRPSFTIDTLDHISKLDINQTTDFSLIIGEDNLTSFTQWKRYNEILDRFRILVYPRPRPAQTPLLDHPNVEVIKAPLLDISSTYIRECVKNDISIKYLVHSSVGRMIRDKKFYS